MEVEYVRNPAGNAVCQLAGHAVFRNLREQFPHPLVPFASDLATDLGGQCGEGGAFA